MSIPSGLGYIPSYPGTYPGMEHPGIFVCLVRVYRYRYRRYINNIPCIVYTLYTFILYTVCKRTDEELGISCLCVSCVGPSAASCWPLCAALYVMVRFCAALCVGRPAASCWPLSVPDSRDIHPLHVVHRLCCGALAHKLCTLFNEQKKSVLYCDIQTYTVHTYPRLHIRLYLYTSLTRSRLLAFTRYCHNQYCMVCGIGRGGRQGGRMLRTGRGIVFQ